MKPKPATRPTARKAPPAAPEPRRSTFGLPGRIDQSLPTGAGYETRIEPMLLAALGLFPLLLASASLIWLLHVRAEAYR